MPLEQSRTKDPQPATRISSSGRCHDGLLSRFRLRMLGLQTGQTS